MFPLGSVLFPHAALPLHVFEPRYRALVEHCLANEPEFGVVLIERGSEVGGGDSRFGTGTVARIVEASQFPDGRYALVTLGIGRLRVREWLPDAPYPLATVVDLDDAPGDATVMAEARDAVEQRLRRVLTLATELGAPVAPGDVRLDPDPVRAGYEACGLAPIGSLDAQRLLELDDPALRLARLDEQLTDLAGLLELRLGES